MFEWFRPSELPIYQQAIVGIYLGDALITFQRWVIRRYFGKKR